MFPTFLLVAKGINFSTRPQNLVFTADFLSTTLFQVLLRFYFVFLPTPHYRPPPPPIPVSYLLSYILGIFPFTISNGKLPVIKEE